MTKQTNPLTEHQRKASAAQKKKYGKRKMREWGKKGGRPKKIKP
jgi:hypothetical protein